MMKMPSHFPLHGAPTSVYFAMECPKEGYYECKVTAKVVPIEPVVETRVKKKDIHYKIEDLVVEKLDDITRIISFEDFIDLRQEIYPTIAYSDLEKEVYEALYDEASWAGLDGIDYKEEY